MSRPEPGNMLFILRSLPDAQGHSLGMDAALAAAAIDRPVSLLLAFPQAAAAVRQAMTEEQSPVRLLRAADLFGLQELILLAWNAEQPPSPQPELPVALKTVTPASLPQLIGCFSRVFSYP